MRSLLLVLVLLALLPAAAAAQGSRDLWATVNVCDTAGKPNTLGVRGSMPGLKHRTTLRMRFRVQYLAPDGRWLIVRRNADSGWQKVGTRRGGRVESGSNFTFAPPKSGDIVLRGVVYFQWRRGGRVEQRARKVTEGGHVTTVGADPPGFSAGTCRIA
jgi:hypothetical protein